MPRPSRKTDEKLIRTAQAMMEHSGLSQLNLRQVAEKAGVNLGMFHYHFKTKDAFIKAVLQDTYEKFFEDFSLQVDSQTQPLEKLRTALVKLSQFGRDNRHLVLSLLQDALNRDKSVGAFVKKNMHRHAKVILELIEQCKAQGSLPPEPVPFLMSYIMTATTGGALVLGVFEHGGAKKSVTNYFRTVAHSDEAIVKRVNWVLKGLGPTHA